MSGIFTQELRLKNRDVDMYRRLRTSKLFELLQEASIAHTEALGMGREKTLDRGLLWVVALQRAEIRRLPEYDELIRVQTWPGEPMHVLFPRHYLVETAAGEELLRGSALWMLTDAKTRRFVFPEKYGVEIPGVTVGGELPLPTAPAPMETDREREFTVPFSYVDLNGHMNNTRFFELAEDCFAAPAAGKRLRSVQTEYKTEARLRETLTLRWCEQNGAGYMTGAGDKTAFSLRMEYD